MNGEPGYHRFGSLHPDTDKPPRNACSPRASPDCIKNGEQRAAMQLRPATSDDLLLLRYWDTKPQVIAATGDDGDFGWETELQRNPQWRELLIAEADNRPIGMIQIIDPATEETHYWGDIEANLRAIDIWIGEDSDLGKGYGTRMMQLALERCFANATVKAVLVDPLASNTRAHRFYERLGFRPVERRMFNNDDCIVYRLERQAWPARRASSNS